MSVSIDDLFDKIDELSKNMHESQNATKKNGSTQKTDFKNLEMTFLGAAKGTYELKIFIDSDGNLSEEVWMHTIKGAKDKVTVTCTGDDCEICKRQAKLESMKNKAAWKYRKYKINKIFVKIGDIQSNESKSLKPNTPYVAYVDDKYLTPLIDTLKANRKYYKDDIGKMLNATAKSGGLLVTASSTTKSTIYNFNFIPSIEVNGIDPKDVFGSDKYLLANNGYFRNNYVNKDKLAKGIQMMDGLILATADKSVKPNNDLAIDPSESGTDFKDACPEEYYVSNSPDPLGSKDGSTPSNNSEKVLDNSKMSDNGKQVCFTNFDPSSDQCNDCTNKRPCLLETMQLGKI